MGILYVYRVQAGFLVDLLRASRVSRECGNTFYTDYIPLSLIPYQEPVSCWFNGLGRRNLGSL